VTTKIFSRPKASGERLQNEDETGGGAIGIGDNEAGVVAAIFLLRGNGIEMGCIDLGNEQRNIRVHAVIARIADDGIAGASKILLGRASDGRIESGKDEVAVERRVETLDDEIARGPGDGRVEMPANGFGVSPAGGTLGRGDFGEVKPGMVAEHLNKALADDTCGAEDSGLPFFLRSRHLHVLISVVLR